MFKKWELKRFFLLFYFDFMVVIYLKWYELTKDENLLYTFLVYLGIFIYLCIEYYIFLNKKENE